MHYIAPAIARVDIRSPIFLGGRRGGRSYMISVGLLMDSFRNEVSIL